MDEETTLQILRLRRRVAELESRLTQPQNWTIGEIEIFKRQIRTAQSKLIEFSKRDDSPWTGIL
jgi:hypothetical protein